MTQRMGESLDVPLSRQRWLGDGEHLDVGDRVLYAVRPPIFDAPTTRGLFDPTTGVYWGSDSFATPMLTPTTTVHDIDDGVLGRRHRHVRHATSARGWRWSTSAGSRRSVDRVAALGATTLAGCHTPAVTGARVPKVFDLLRQVTTAEVPPQPDQAVLEQILESLLVGAN